MFQYMFKMIYIFCLVLNSTARCIWGLYKGRSSLYIHSKWDVHQAIQKTNYPKGHRKKWGENIQSIQPITVYFDMCLLISSYDIGYLLVWDYLLQIQFFFNVNVLLHQILIAFFHVSAQPHDYSKSITLNLYLMW